MPRSLVTVILHPLGTGIKIETNLSFEKSQTENSSKKNDEKERIGTIGMEEENFNLKEHQNEEATNTTLEKTINSEIIDCDADYANIKYELSEKEIKVILKKSNFVVTPSTEKDQADCLIELNKDDYRKFGVEIVEWISKLNDDVIRKKCEYFCEY